MEISIGAQYVWLFGSFLVFLLLGISGVICAKKFYHDVVWGGGILLSVVCAIPFFIAFCTFLYHICSKVQGGTG